jgi:hypothetical protein
MRPLAERHADRAARKLENQGEDSRKAEGEAGFDRAGIGVVNPEIVPGGDLSKAGWDSPAVTGNSPAGAGNGGGTSGDGTGSGGEGWGGGSGGGSDPLSQSIPNLTSHLEGVNDAAELDRLIAAETAGQNRAGALAALEARKAALASA